MESCNAYSDAVNGDIERQDTLVLEGVITIKPGSKRGSTPTQTIHAYLPCRVSDRVVFRENGMIVPHVLTHVAADT